MLILAVDTSSRSGSLAVLRGEMPLAAVASHEGEPHSSGLFRSLSGVLGELKLDLHQIDLFAVATGPGSFTGLRVGLTAVKAWAEVYRKPIAAISGLEAIAAQGLANGAWRDSNAHLFAPFMDARRGQLYGAIYRRNSDDSNGLALTNEDSILSFDEFLESINGKSPEPVHLVSPTPELLPPARLRELLPGAQII